MRPITKGKEVTHDEQAEVDVIEDSVDNLNSSDIKALVLYRARENVLQTTRQYFLLESLQMTHKCNIVVTERKPRKY